MKKGENMRFFKWIIDATNRHSGDIKRYEKAKIGYRIFVIFLMIALVGLALGVQYWCANLFKNDDVFLGFLAVIFLGCTTSLIAIEYCGIYSYIAFKMFFLGTLESIIKKVEDKKTKKYQLKQDNDSKENSTKDEELAKTNSSEKNSGKAHKWIDLFIGILGVVLAIGTLIGFIIMLVNITK